MMQKQKMGEGQRRKRRRFKPKSLPKLEHILEMVERILPEEKSSQKFVEEFKQTEGGE